VFGPKFKGLPAPANGPERFAEVENQLAFFEKVFLGGDKKFQYINNQPSLTIADLRYYTIN
jgi:hypothetical protein